jgi:hypothetical protein
MFCKLYKDCNDNSQDNFGLDYAELIKKWGCDYFELSEWGILPTSIMNIEAESRKRHIPEMELDWHMQYLRDNSYYRINLFNNKQLEECKKIILQDMNTIKNEDE